MHAIDLFKARNLDLHLRTIDEGLAALRAPVGRRLRPGLSPRQLEKALATFPFRLPEEVLALYRWHNGTSGFRPYDLYPGYRLLSIQVSLRRARWAMRFAMRHLGDDWQQMWNPRWFPVFELDGKESLIVIGGDEERETAPVYRFFVEDGEPSEQYPSLTALLAEVADCFRSGAYVLDEHGQIREDSTREAEVLRRRGPDRADAILETLRARPEAPELEALSSDIGRYRDPRWVDPLIALLSPDSDLEQQRMAAFLLGGIGDPRAGDPLLEALGRVHPTVKPAVLAALAGLGDRRVEEPALELLRTSSNLEVRRSAAQALESGASEETLRALAAMLEEYPPIPVRMAIQDVLARHGFGGAKRFDFRELLENPRLRAQAEAEIDNESDPFLRQAGRNNLDVVLRFAKMSPVKKLLLSLWGLLRSLFFFRP